MENILSILSFNSLYTILISILTMCVMYYGVNRFSYVINIFLYMLSRTLIGFVVSKF